MERFAIKTVLCSFVLALSALAHAEENPAKQTPLDNPPALEAPTYLLIPVKGVIGRDFTTATMKAYLQSAEKQKANVVVLEVDTGGGDVRDAEEIVDLIIAHKGLRFVALVRRALSAGATITLACKDIYVTEGAMIGGAVSYSLGQNGLPVQLPADVAEKFQSIWRAVCRKAAEHGGHPSLIAEAMVDPAFALTMRKEGDKVVLERNGKGDVLKADNRILTLTAREAVSCQLAKGIVENLDALGVKLSMSGWKALSLRPGDSLPERKGVPGEFTPSVFYDLLLQKAIALKMTEPTTNLQNKKAKEDFEAWFKEQKFFGRPVRWAVSLEQAEERKETIYALKKELRSAEVNLMVIGMPMRSTSGSGSASKREYVRCQQEVSRIKQQLKEAEAYPFVLVGTGLDEPMILIQAIISKPSGESLAKESPGSKITFSGTIVEVRPYLYEDRSFLVIVFLDRCSLAGEKPPAGSPAEQKTLLPPGSKDLEAIRKASSDLNLAHTFRRNGLNEKAQALLKSIIAAYPGTPQAEEARQELQEIEEEIRKAQEDQKTPKISSQEKK
jgi:ATP-dependent protease ClpP protease subunit